MPLHFKPMSDLGRFLVAELRFLKLDSGAELFLCMMEYEFVILILNLLSQIFVLLFISLLS